MRDEGCGHIRLVDFEYGDCRVTVRTRWCERLAVYLAGREDAVVAVVHQAETVDTGCICRKVAEAMLRVEPVSWVCAADQSKVTPIPEAPHEGT